MKITDLKCTVLGQNPVVRITTDEGISGLGEVEASKSYLKPHVLFYKDMILGQDPTNVERVMLSIRRLGSFKPWGSAVSAIEMALWDIAGKAAGLPVVSTPLGLRGLELPDGAAVVVEIDEFARGIRDVLAAPASDESLERVAAGVRATYDWRVIAAAVAPAIGVALGLES